MLNKIKEIEYIISKIEKCEKCPLHLTRQNVVPGEGNINSPILFIGEGPGQEEDATGRPFVGKAGQYLTTMLENWAKISRSDIYIANIVKCRPPKNRVPSEEKLNIVLDSYYPKY